MVARTNELIHQKKILPHIRQGLGQPLVFVHGFFGGAKQWKFEIEYFSKNYDVIAFDLPGFGGAAHISGHERIENMADALITSIEALGIKKYCLLGHSMGGMIAQNIAIKHQNCIEKLVLYGTGPLGIMPDRFEPISVSKKRLAEEGVEKTIHHLAATWLVKGAEDSSHRFITDIGGMANIQSALSALDAMKIWDGRGELSQISMPTLIIWGDRDRSYLWAQEEELWKKIPNSSLAVLPNCSHAAHLECGEIFCDIVYRFLS